MKPPKITYLLGSLLSLGLLACSPSEEAKPIGSSLHKKSELQLSEIPDEALKAVLALQPDFKATEADQEFQYGKTYIDIGGTLGDGREVEFDLVLLEGKWKVAEMQTDLTMEQCPQLVLKALNGGAPGFQPSRIIKSDQLNGVVIYAFIAVTESGQERLKEVKVEDGVASLLLEKWRS